MVPYKKSIRFGKGVKMKTQGQPKLAEAILPDLVWELVLKSITEPADILNAWETCTLFRKFLYSKMVAVNFGKTLPLLMGCLDAKSILNCRLVSKGWRDNIDKFFENDFLKGAKSSHLKPFPVTRHSTALYSFDWNKSKMVMFMEEMEDHPRNPFVGRAIHFILEPDDEFEEFPACQRLFEFLALFGKHIWTLQLEILEPVRLFREVQDDNLFPFLIKDVFEFVPNLRSFLIKVDNIPEPFEPPPFIMHRSVIRKLPEPQALEYLDVSYFNNADDLLKAVLLRHSNTQLKVLHLKNVELLQRLNWPNLRQLHFTDIECLDKVDRLFSNLRLPKLESLSIAVDYWGTDKPAAFKTFFRALSSLCKNSPELKTLRFSTTWLWDKESNEDVGFPKRGLECPNITSLEIPEGKVCASRRLWGNTFTYSDYSFLLRFPNVQNIHLDPTHPEFTPKELETTSSDEIVQVHKYLYNESMYESNIWTELPRLNIFSFGERVYSRKSYERHFPPMKRLRSQK